MSSDHVILGCELQERFGVSKETLLALGPDCTFGEVIQLITAVTKEDEDLVFQQTVKFLKSKLLIEAEIFRESKLVSDLHFGLYD